MATIKSNLLMWCCIFLVALQGSEAQHNTGEAQPAPLKKSMVRITVQEGSILQQDWPFLTTQNEYGYDFKEIRAISIEYGWEMLDGKEWHQTCKNPRLGLGLQYMHFMHRNELGHPISIYGFLDGNYIKTKNFEITNRMALGLAYGFKTYQPDDPFPNDIFSTRLNVFAELGIGFAVRLYNSLYIEPGFRFTHFSNGNIREPQRGLNIPAYSLGLRSTLGKKPLETEKLPLTNCLHQHEVLAFLGMGYRQLEFNSSEPTKHETYNLNFLMANLHLGYNYELSRRFKLGGGADLVYDGTNGMKEAGMAGKPQKNSVPFIDKAGISLFLSLENTIERLSIVTTAGYMVAQTRFESSTPAFEQRLGFKYHIYPDVFVGLNVRAYNFRAAKALELNIGTRRILGKKMHDDNSSH